MSHAKLGSEIWLLVSRASKHEIKIDSLVCRNGTCDAVSTEYFYKYIVRRIIENNSPTYVLLLEIVLESLRNTVKSFGRNMNQMLPVLYCLHLNITVNSVIRCSFLFKILIARKRYFVFLRHLQFLTQLFFLKDRNSSSLQRNNIRNYMKTLTSKKCQNIFNLP